MSVSVIPLRGMPEVVAGDDLVALIDAALTGNDVELDDADVVVVASKVVSKAEARRVTVDPAPSARAEELARACGFDARQVELILTESRAVLRAAPGVLVVETRHGFVCANAGIDRSNTGPDGGALLLPLDSDASARDIQAGLLARRRRDVAVLVSDTFGRPFRHGLVNVALGVAGMRAIRDYRGDSDPAGYTLRGTELAVADELCSASELVMNKLDRVPVAIVRGYVYARDAGGVAPLLRDPARDYFR